MAGAPVMDTGRSRPSRYTGTSRGRSRCRRSADVVDPDVEPVRSRLVVPGGLDDDVPVVMLRAERQLVGAGGVEPALHPGGEVATAGLLELGDQVVEPRVAPGVPGEVRRIPARKSSSPT